MDDWGIDQVYDKRRVLIGILVVFLVSRRRWQYKNTLTLELEWLIGIAYVGQDSNMVKRVNVERKG